MDPSPTDHLHVLLPAYDDLFADMLWLRSARSPPKGQDHGGPHRPPIRPHAAVRSKFDLEVNPFEQSFSRESQHSNSSLSDRATPPRGTDATAIKHNALPPLSSLTSPAAADPSQFPWLANQSLRTGPLSPAMLAGPQAPHGHHANGTPSRTGQTGDANGPDNSFDANAFRTGFTPGAGTGLTPGYSSLIGNNFASSLPMPSPNTAAFLNMVTNSTPLGENNDESNNQPNTHQNNGHPPSAIPPHMQPQHHGLSHIQNNPNVPQDTITPNTLSALTGVMNEMSRQPNGQNNQTYYPQQMNQQQPNNAGHVDYAQQSANAASQAANGLFLLSQAHQELSKREEEDSKSSPASKKGAPKVNGANGAGQKRKSDASLVNGKPNGVGPPAGPPAKKGKRASMPKQESFSPDMDSDIDEDEDKQPLGRPETEEEKRKNFLERNRQGQQMFGLSRCGLLTDDT